MSKLNGYIHVTNTNENTAAPWELVFKGEDIKQFVDAFDDPDNTSFMTAEEALLKALKLQRLSPATNIILDTDGDEIFPSAHADYAEEDIQYLLEPS